MTTRPYRVVKKTHEAADTASLVLAPADGAPPPPFEPGQFVTLEHLGQVRCYSLSAAPNGRDLRITVKARPEAGPAGAGPGVSRALVRDVRAGDALQLRAPAGTFTLGPGDDPVVLVAGGIGVTPFASMVLARAERRSGGSAPHGLRPIHLVVGARSGEEQPLATELRRAARAAPAVSLHVVYSQPRPGDVLGRDYQEEGRVDAGLLARLIPPAERPYDFYVCGPPAMLDDLVKGLRGLGVPASKVHVEVFDAAAARAVARATGRLSPAKAAAGPGVQVTFARSGKTVPWDPAKGALLYLAEAAGVPIPYGCAAGRCGVCLTRLVSGEVEHGVEPEFPGLRPGACLPCIDLPRTSIELDA